MWQTAASPFFSPCRRYQGRSLPPTQQARDATVLGGSARTRAHLLVGHVYRHGLQHCRHALHLGGFGRLLGARRLLGSTRWGARGQRREGARQQGGDNDDGFETQRRHCPSVEQLQKTCRGAAWIQSRGVPAKWTKREAEKGIP